MSDDYYILDADGNAVPEPDLLKWAAWYEISFPQRLVARDDTEFYTVSTVFIALNHRGIGGDVLHGPNPGGPVLWETMVFSRETHIEEFHGKLWKTPEFVDHLRYTSREQAEEGHHMMVELYRTIELNTKAKLEGLKPVIFDMNQFKDVVAEIEDAIGKDDHMALSMALFKVFDKGAAWERDRIIPIIRRLAVDPQRIVHEIRRPVR